MADAQRTPAPARPARDSQTCTLANGRVLGFAEYGDAAGHPVLAFHGYPSSRLAMAVMDEPARRLGLRLLALDRPGFGLSPAQPGRRIADWTDDVQAFAAQQRLETFGVLGVSGGGPYALACASALPADKISCVGLMAGTGPSDGSATKHIPRKLRLAAVLIRRCPFVLRTALAGTLASLRWLVRQPLVCRAIEAWMVEADDGDGDGDGDRERRTGLLSAADDSNNNNNNNNNSQRATPAEAREAFLHLAFDAFAQGAAPVIDEAELLLSPSWGFRFEDIVYGPIYAWHGGRDKNVPLEWVLPMMRRLPHLQLKVYPDKDHAGLLDEAEEMLAVFVPATNNQQASMRPG